MAEGAARNENGGGTKVKGNWDKEKEGRRKEEKHAETRRMREKHKKEGERGREIEEG